MENKNVNMSPGEGKISIIVPVYNVEPYLRTCIDSILAQTFTEFELILVDDGSPDNCGAICEEYAEKDNRIVVIHQENAGLSAARNAGIDWVFANSDSQWITFVDSDDAVVQNYLEVLYQYAVEQNADIVNVYYSRFHEISERETVPQPVYGHTVMTGRDACKSLYNGQGKIPVMAWGKLYKRSVFCEQRFLVGKIHEDQYVIPKLLFEASCVVALRSWMYLYRVSPTSITHRKFFQKRFDDIDALNSCIDFFKEKGDDEMVSLAKYKKKTLWADYTIRARESNIYKNLPKEYKMPLWKAYWILAIDTIHRGGIKFVARRIGNMLRRRKRK